MHKRWIASVHRSHIRSSIDDAVGAQQDRPRQHKPDRPGSMAIDDQFQPRRPLDRQLTGLRAPEDAIDVVCGPPGVLLNVLSVAHQAAGLDERRE